MAGVAEDAKVLRMGRGLSGGEMGSKCCRSVEEGDGRARVGVRTGLESPLHMATMLVATEISDSTSRRWDWRPH